MVCRSAAALAGAGEAWAGAGVRVLGRSGGFAWARRGLGRRADCWKAVACYVLPWTWMVLTSDRLREKGRGGNRDLLRPTAARPGQIAYRRRSKSNLSRRRIDTGSSNRKILTRGFPPVPLPIPNFEWSKPAPISRRSTRLNGLNEPYRSPRMTHRTLLPPVPDRKGPLQASFHAGRWKRYKLTCLTKCPSSLLSYVAYASSGSGHHRCRCRQPDRHWPRGVLGLSAPTAQRRAAVGEF